ncbi:hypothetical protein MMC19_004095 [Ptychographa xylographoides]|nr:hypothetical protein [Ptychographa xylographoides]
MTVNVASTCMASQGPNRVDVAQCVLLKAIAGIRGPSMSHPPPNAAAGGMLGPSFPHPPPDMFVGGVPALNVPHPPPDILAVQQPLNHPGPSGAGRDPPSFGRDPSGAGGGTSGAGPSTSQSYHSPAELAGLGLIRILPGVPPENTSARQTTYVGAGIAVVAGTWVLGLTGWQDGARKRHWKTNGQWFLLLGIGAPTPFPLGAVPPWTGGRVWTTSIKPASTGHEETPISEAWIAVDGIWRPLAGMAPPSGTWLTNGGWVLLKGNSRA